MSTIDRLSRKNANLLVSHRVPNEIVLAQHHTLVLVPIPPPHAVQFPQALTLGGAFRVPRLPASRVQDLTRGETGGHREGTCPVTNFRRVSSTQHKGLEWRR